MNNTPAPQALETAKSWLSDLLVLAASGFALYTGAVGPFQAPIQRGIFALLLLPLVFLRVPSGWCRTKAAEIALALLLSAATAVVMGWTVFDFERLYSDPFIGTVDTWLGAVGLILVLEAVRRTVGLAVTLVLAGFLAYALLGRYMPFELLRHAGLRPDDLVSFVFYGTFGVFGTPLGVCATFIVIIILLGAFLTSTGGAEMFMNIGKAVAGRFVGGPAKIAVVSSSLMGMITGATVANIATTGTVTIPMMKRSGYEPRFAAAVEALASCGGQLMPPIMGAAAFIMIDYLNMSYGELILHAVVPALLYSFAVLMIVHFRSVKTGIQPIASAEIPRLSGELIERGNMLIPIVILLALLAEQFSVMYAGFCAVACAMAVCQLRSGTRLRWSGYLESFRQAMRGMITLVPICAGAGIMIGVMTATGLNLRMTYLIEDVAQGSLFLTLLLTMVACLILGMGLPTVAAYVVLATLIPTTLTNLGISPVAAHLFLFYFAILSAITPPVCTGAYVAAGIAGADPIQTGFVAMRLGLISFLLPFAFVYDPSLLLMGNWEEIVLHVGSCSVGILFWSIALEGYLDRWVPTALRAALLVSGGLLVWPDPWISATGAGIGGVALLLLFRVPKASSAQS